MNPYGHVFSIIERDYKNTLQLLNELTIHIIEDGKIALPKLISIQLTDELIVRHYVDTEMPSFIQMGSKKLALLLAVVDLVTEAIVEKQILSLRGIYYTLKREFITPKFVSIRECYQIVSLLSRITRLPRHCLKIYASTRGIVAGPIKVQTNSIDSNLLTWTEDAVGGFISIRSEIVKTQSTKISPLFDKNVKNLNYILVVEKETIFRILVNKNFHGQHNCVIVCGRGMPCIATRAFLKLLSTTFPNRPIFGITDRNPYGLDILLKYAHGGDNSFESYLFAVPQIRGIGLLAEDVNDFGLRLLSSRQPLTSQDIRKCNTLIEKYSNSQSIDVVYECTSMISTGFKFELESLNNVLADNSDFLYNTWLPKLVEEEFKRMK